MHRQLHRIAAATLLAVPLLAMSGIRRGRVPTPAGTILRSVSPSVVANMSQRPAGVEVTLTAAPARLAMVPGGPTEMLTYNGTSPGPTLEVHEGDRVIVHFRNRLDEPSTIHWHGMHIPFAADGSPYDPVAPGDSFNYVFTVPNGSAGTYWYHPHPDHRTGFQVARGLYGALIVRAKDDPLPGTLTEQVLVLSDNRFRDDGSIDLPDRHTKHGRIDEENGREGDVVFVSGMVRPSIAIRSGEVQRWRIINASAARVYRLSIPGHTFLHVGSDGGLFEKPAQVSEITVAPAERVEVLVRATAPPGTTTELQALPYDRYIPQTRPADWKLPRTLLTLQYDVKGPVVAPAIPATLRRIEWIDTSNVSAHRVMALSQGMINGRKMDLARVDVTAPLGATEIWEVENLVGMDHPFHLHGFQFQVLSRNGEPEPFPSWKDVVNVPKHESARFVVRFDDFPGKWMFHCHILDHEDHGMMGVLEITPARGR
ncbi:MAG: multicopper oxidase family protein [Gemmatimonadales bacterium]